MAEKTTGIGTGPSGSSGLITIADSMQQLMNFDVERIEGWHWCHICVTPFPSVNDLVRHQKAHIGRAIAAR